MTGTYQLYENIIVVTIGNESYIRRASISEDGKHLYLWSHQEDGTLFTNELKKGLNVDLLVGNWNYAKQNGKYEDSTSFQFETLNSDGTGIYICSYNQSIFSMEDIVAKSEKWSIEDSIITFSFSDTDELFSWKILDLTDHEILGQTHHTDDEGNLEYSTITAERVVEDYSKHIIGTWTSDIFYSCLNSIEYKDVTMTFKENGKMDFHAIGKEEDIIFTDQTYIIFGNLLAIMENFDYLFIWRALYLKMDPSGDSMECYSYYDNVPYTNTFTKQ